MKFSYEKVADCISELEVVKNKISDSFDNITNNIKKIGSNNTWNGDAAKAFQSKANVVTNNFDLIINELQGTILYLNNVSNNYKALDKKVMSSTLFSSSLFR